MIIWHHVSYNICIIIFFLLQTPFQISNFKLSDAGNMNFNFNSHFNNLISIKVDISLRIN